nr:hypothetical protein [Tanacetum cinerariifolium]
QASQDQYYQTSRSHRSSAPSSKPSIPSRSQTTTKHKGNEIAKPITPPSETASEEDSDPEQAQRGKDMQKNLALIAKYFKKIYKPTNNNLRTSSNSKNKNVDMTSLFKNDNQSRKFGNQRTVNVVAARENVGSQVGQQSRIRCFNCREYGHFAKERRKPKRVKDSAYYKEKMLLCKQAEQGVPLQAEQYDWLEDTDEEVDEQDYMAKIQEVPTADSCTDSEPVEQVQNDAGYNVFANVLQHSKQSESVSNTCLVETDDSNVILDSPDMCEDDIQNDQNDVKSDDERVALVNLIGNLKLDVDENKKIQKQLEKANTTLTQELKECKAILAKTKKEAIHLILTGIEDDIYSTVDACQTAQEMWEAIEMLQQGESLNIQDVKTNLFWEFGKFTSHEGESMESYYTRFYKLMNAIIRNNLTMTTIQVNVQFLQQLQPEWSRFVTIVKQQHKLDEVSYHKLFDILKQYQNEVNELRAKKLARNANQLASVATTQASQDQYYQTSRSHRSSAPSPKPSIPSRSHTSTRPKGKEIAKPITPPSETASEEDNDPEQAQRDKDIQKNLALIAKYFKKMFRLGRIKPKRVKDSAYHKEKMLLCKQAEQGVPLQAEQYDWLADTDEEVDEQVLEAHYNYMAKIQEVPTADSGTNSEPVEQTKQAEFEKFKAFNDRTIDYDKLECKLNDALGQLAHNDTVIREGLKTKAYKLSVVKEKHDELMKQSLLTKSHYEGLVKKKRRRIPDREETLALERESRSKLNTDLVHLDALDELQCLYLHKVKECDCLAQKLSK